ncbi:MAG: hypothetical protein PF481_04210 [Bacteroidales bacterium]|jgi:hypothetical protein|nr:hypothetical protein [Bacteroidales bacterium]
MKFFGFLLMFLLLFSCITYAQISTGGNVGVSYENNVMQVDVAPEVNYLFTEKISAGFSPFVLYTQNELNNQKFFTFGTRLYGEYTFIENFFVHVEYELSKTWTQENYKTAVHSLPLGGGFEKELGSGMVAYGMILYDVLYDAETSIRKNPTVRGGIRYSL